MKKYLLILCFFYFSSSLAITINVAPKIDVENLTIKKIHQLIVSHESSCENIVSLYLKRIKKFNLSLSLKPSINALTQINLSAIQNAKNLDEKINHGNTSGALLCVPVILKDNIDTFDTHSSSGSLAMRGNQPIQDAPLVAQLRNAGAIILGKGSMDELASGTSGISSLSGRIGNVYDTTQNSGGSSGGPAASVAASFSIVAIGSDNSGSVRIPAALQGQVGLRPSKGLISDDGIIPRGKIDGVAGPIAANVEDLAAVLDVIVQPKYKLKNSYLSYLNENVLDKQRLGVVNSFDKINAYENMPNEFRDKFLNFVNKLKLSGAKIFSNVQLPEFNSDRKFNEAGEGEDVEKYLASYPAKIKNYLDICIGNKSLIFDSEKDCSGYLSSLPKRNSKEYQLAQNNIEKNRKYIEEYMNKYHLNALIIPVSRYGIANYGRTSFENEKLASNSGLPAITFPIGYSRSGMPIGVELIGKKWHEKDLIAIAYAYEKKYFEKIFPILPKENLKFMTMSDKEYNESIFEYGQKIYEDVIKNKGKLTPLEYLSLQPSERK